MNGISIFIDPRFWLAIVLSAAISAVPSYLKGRSDKEAEHVKDLAKAAAAAVDAERDLRAESDQWTSDFINDLTKQLEAARALPKISLPVDCAVPADVGSLLNSAQRLHPDAGSGPGSRAAGAAVDSSCAEELDIAKRNYAEVCIPNAKQLTELQERWRQTERRVNKLKE